MTAEDIYEFLKKNKGQFYSTRQISEELEIRQQTVSRSLNILSRYDDIVCEYRKLYSRYGSRYKKNKKNSATKQSWVYAYVKNKGDDKIGR